MSKASTGIRCLQLKAPIALKYRKEKCSSEYRKDPLYRVRKPGSLKSLLTHTRRKSYLGKIPGPISSYGPRNYSLSWFSLLCSCFLWRSSVSLPVCAVRLTRCSLVFWLSVSSVSRKRRGYVDVI